MTARRLALVVVGAMAFGALVAIGIFWVQAIADRLSEDAERAFG